MYILHIHHVYQVSVPESVKIVRSTNLTNQIVQRYLHVYSPQPSKFAGEEYSCNQSYSKQPITGVKQCWTETATRASKVDGRSVGFELINSRLTAEPQGDNRQVMLTVAINLSEMRRDTILKFQILTNKACVSQKK